MAPQAGRRLPLAPRAEGGERGRAAMGSGRGGLGAHAEVVRSLSGLLHLQE